MGLQSNVEKVTPLYYEMHICEALGMSHSDFLSLLREDKLKWHLYFEFKYKKDKYWEGKQKEELDRIRNKKGFK